MEGKHNTYHAQISLMIIEFYFTATDFVNYFLVLYVIL